jgi:hypothetical protein
LSRSRSRAGESCAKSGAKSCARSASSFSLSILGGRCARGRAKIDKPPAARDSATRPLSRNPSGRRCAPASPFRFAPSLRLSTRRSPRGGRAGAWGQAGRGGCWMPSGRRADDERTTSGRQVDGKWTASGRRADGERTASGRRAGGGERARREFRKYAPIIIRSGDRKCAEGARRDFANVV